MVVRRSPRRRNPPAPPFVRSWERQSWPLRILRAFLGITFTYAGLQKLADPNFLSRGSRDYIGSQLQAFARGSPIGPLLHLAGHAPEVTGVAIALLETGIGLATLAGVAATAAAAVGIGISVILFLSATWHVHPYFLGSDSIYAVAWTAYLVGTVEVTRHARRAVAAQGSRRARRQALDTPIGRREFLRGGVLGAGTLLLSAVAGAIGLAGHPTRIRTLAAPGTGVSGTPGSTGTPIAALNRLPIGGAVGFNDPSQGPAVLIRLGQDHVVAFSRTCTHAGCPVQWDQSARLLVCPCHGAEFDPAHGAQPIAGPAPTPLAPIQVAIDQATGKVVATD